MKELWKDIKGFENKYAISNLGNVYSYYLKHNMSLNKNRSGNYVGVVLYKDGKQYRFQVHRLVAEAFIPNPYNLPLINHKNEIQNDNRAENLEWCDYRYNSTYNDVHKRVGKKVSETMRKNGGPHNKGKYMSQEQKDKISKSMRGHKFTGNQYTRNICAIQA